MGEQINGYELITSFQGENAGFSQWALAMRRGKEYFLKEFVDPTYPDEESLSPALRERRIAECAAFEKEKRELYETINRASDGNTVKVFEFFRHDSHYYISNRKIISAGLSFEEIAALPLEDRVLLCRTAAHSVMKLHEAHIVHSDIKNTNVMVQRTATGKLCAKIIDFDCSFFEAKPPKTEEELGGDQVYLAPEACQLICGDPVDLTCKVDVFALGLLFHEYLTGNLPDFDRSQYDYAHEAALDGCQLVVSDKLPYQLRRVLEQMLVCDPAERCDLKVVFDAMAEFLPEADIVEPIVRENSVSIETDSEVTIPKEFFFTAGDL